MGDFKYIQQQDSVPGMVSTVITSFNKGPYVAEAIESALRQDVASHEIIVVDDGSTDDTRQVAESFGSTILYFYQPNQGPAAAKNRGIELGKGEYVAFLDGDDRWCPGKLRPRVELLEKKPHVGLVYGRAATMSLTPGVPPKPYFPPHGFHTGKVLDELLVSNFIPFSSAVLRRSCIVEAGMLDRNLWIADDYEFWLRIAQKCVVDFVDEVVIDYRVGIDQITGRISDQKHCDCEIRILREFVRNSCGGRYPRPEVFRRGIASKYASLGDHLLAKHMHARALVAHCRAACWNPSDSARWASIARDFIPNRAAPRLRYALSRLF